MAGCEGDQSPSRGHGKPCFLHGALRAHSSHSAGCPHPPAWHRSHSRASASSRLHRCLSAAQAARTDTRNRPLHPDRRPDHRGVSERQARHQRPPLTPGSLVRLPAAQPPRPPHSAPAAWNQRDRPSAPQSTWARTPPPRPPPPSSRGWGRPPRGAAWGSEQHSGCSSNKY